MKSYKVNCEIPEPVLLNCWKHHAGFIRSKIIDYKVRQDTDYNSLTKKILLIGNSLMDLYLGEMTPALIAENIITRLKYDRITGKESYQNWLDEGGDDYREVEIADDSRWTLRRGEREERYVHIHPSRYSPHTMRVRSSSLKSAILFCVMDGGKSSDILKFINRIRKEYLELPPLKSINSASALMQLVKTLS